MINFLLSRHLPPQLRLTLLSWALAQAPSANNILYAVRDYHLSYDRTAISPGKQSLEQ